MRRPCRTEAALNRAVGIVKEAANISASADASRTILSRRHGVSAETSTHQLQRRHRSRRRLALLSFRLQGTPFRRHLRAWRVEREQKVPAKGTCAVPQYPCRVFINPDGNGGIVAKRILQRSYIKVPPRYGRRGCRQDHGSEPVPGTRWASRTSSYARVTPATFLRWNH